MIKIPISTLEEIENALETMAVEEVRRFQFMGSDSCLWTVEIIKTEPKDFGYYKMPYREKAKC